MKLKAMYHDGSLCLFTESGEIIENAKHCMVFPTGMDAVVGKRVQCRFSLIVDLEASGKIVEADEKAVRALPSPAIVEEDYYSPGEIGPWIHDEDCDCLECEWEDEDEDA